MIDDIFTPEDVANAEDRMRQEAAARARAVSELDYLRRVEQAARAVVDDYDVTGLVHDTAPWIEALTDSIYGLRNALDTQPRQEGTASHE